MEVLSPRSGNLPMAPPPKPIKKPKASTNPKPQDKPTNPDRIEDKWRPPVTITEPGASPETYLIGKKLGKGGFAVCFEGKSKRTSAVLALKVVKAKVEQKKMMEKFRTELQIHAKMHHPNIVEFLRAFTIEDHTYVVLEMCPNGSLAEMVKARSCLSLPEVRRYMVQICGGVKYLHRRSVIHRDLKMGNIFIDSCMNLKIGDFGLAAVMADEQDRRTTLCGTPNYIAPEILSKSGNRGHDNKVDTWAVGVICYAMLMGTPPFQSKTQQEIYSKLKTLEYEWKLDSKNYIPQQAKDFVSSCLNLNSADRPDMDQLVDHDFFTMGSIADQLELTCLKGTPIWLENADPRGDKVKPGFGISHSRICRECGVGIGSDGCPRASVGIGANISALVEIEAENREGCAPSIPLPTGILYKQFSQAHADWIAHQKQPLLPTRPRNRKPETLSSGRSVSSSVAMKSEFEQMDIASVKTTIHGAISTKHFQSFAAQQRQQALPAAVPRMVEMAPKDNPKVAEKVGADVPVPALLNQRPLRAATIRATRSAALKEQLPTISKTLPRSNTLPNTIEALAKEIEADVEKFESRRVKQVASSTKVSIKNDSGTKSVRSIAAVDKTAPSVPSLSTDISNRVLQAATGNERKVPSDENKTDPTPFRSTVRHRTASKAALEVLRSLPRAHNRIIALDDPYELVRKTGSADVLDSLRAVVHALDNRSADDTPRRPRSAYGSRRARPNTTYPRVDKWVDYSTRHGIAYILSDGSVGMILRSSDDNVRASSCVVVRNGSHHTIRRAKGLDYQFVPQGPEAHNIEFYEQTDYAKEMKRLDVPSSKFQLDLDNHPNQMAALNAVQIGLEGSEAERMKEIALLDKFGKYMNKQTGNWDPSNGKRVRSTILVHFYQRVGNVGVWRFVDGGLQFNFPDHTKVSVYEQRDENGDERYMVDFVYLLSTDATNLANLGMASGEALERRGTMSIPLEEILGDGLRRLEEEVLRTNEIREKLSWIRAVVGCWIKHDGLGRMGEERLGWSGLQERMGGPKIKLQWVTVGRPGGDGDGQLKSTKS
ncbi:PLK protein kinase [Exophiala aquamarina CBS 119918]|uniref:Serine/threonine-protein kinase n=1 Tax=Exophiala aquamarina CBS 119918 TaxID=1182545 RepID=A0A072Q7A1_9EURO|nr:PLK protein kinase [Exophiala aquamarina CBS 119918]KEF63775.1 PLK protein kinase [Exophiala aquamarina CBS 119918]